MEYATLGNTDIKVSKLCVGCMSFGKADGTLRRLGTDYLDLYIIHRFDYDTPIEETMEALNDLVRCGKVRAIGATKASHFDDAAEALALRLSSEEIAYLEEPYCPHKIVGAIDQNPAQRIFSVDWMLV